MTDRETELLQRATGGDRDALGQLLALCQDEVRIALDARIPDRLRAHTAADDLLQITFADALRDVGRARFDGPAAFAAWLKRIALNNLDDAIRAFDAEKRGGGRAHLPLDRTESSQALLSELMADDATVSLPLRSAEALALLSSALDSLPDDYRTVVTLYDLEGRPIEHVAAALGRSAGAVHLLRVRAHRRLRERLARNRTEFRDLV